MKKLTLLAILTIFMMGAALPALPENLAVVDQAGVLSPATISYLVQANDELHNLTGGEVMFYIAEFLPMNWDVADFTRELFNYWQVGSEERDNGILVVMTTAEGYFWATVGGGLDQHMRASYLEQVFENHFFPHFDAGDYDAAVRNLFGVLSGRIYELFPAEGVQGGEVPLNAAGILEAQDNPGTGRSFGDILGIIVFAIIALLIIRLLFAPRRRMGGGMLGRRGFGMGRRRGGLGGMFGGFLGGYLMGRTRHRPRGGGVGGTRPAAPPPPSQGGFTRGGSTRGGGFGGTRGSGSPPKPFGGGGLGGGLGGGRSGGFSRGGGTRGGGFGGRRR